MHWPWMVEINCPPNYPVREAARQALDNLAELERTWRESLDAPSMLP
jgi:hypothetical protein